MVSSLLILGLIRHDTRGALPVAVAFCGILAERRLTLCRFFSPRLGVDDQSALEDANVDRVLCYSWKIEINPIFAFCLADIDSRGEKTPSRTSACGSPFGRVPLPGRPVICEKR